MCISTAKKELKTIFRKFFISFPVCRTGNVSEIAVFADFVWVFSSYFVVFSHKNITNNNTHHQAFFNCQKNWFLKLELSKNRWNSQFSRENCISWISRSVLDIFSWNFVHWRKMIMPKMWRSRIFEKKCFPVTRAGNVPKKAVFWDFLEILSLDFCNFLHKDAH